MGEHPARTTTIGVVHICADEDADADRHKQLIAELRAEGVQMILWIGELADAAEMFDVVQVHAAQTSRLIALEDVSVELHYGDMVGTRAERQILLGDVQSPQLIPASGRSPLKILLPKDFSSAALWDEAHLQERWAMRAELPADTQRAAVGSSLRWAQA